MRCSPRPSGASSPTIERAIHLQAKSAALRRLALRDPLRDGFLRRGCHCCGWHGYGLGALSRCRCHWVFSLGRCDIKMLLEATILEGFVERLFLALTLALSPSSWWGLIGNHFGFSDAAECYAGAAGRYFVCSCCCPRSIARAICSCSSAIFVKPCSRKRCALARCHFADFSSPGFSGLSSVDIAALSRGWRRSSVPSGNKAAQRSPACVSLHQVVPLKIGPWRGGPIRAYAEPLGNNPDGRELPEGNID